MKTLRIKIFLLLLVSYTHKTYSQVGIGNAVPMAALDISSSTDGLLIPRIALTSATTATVISPTISEIIYNTSTAGTSPNNVVPGFYFWNGTRWLPFGGSGGSGWLLSGNTGTNAGTNFLGTTDDVDMVFKRNSINAGKISLLNTSLGLNSQPTNATGRPNSAFGTDALRANANGGHNSAFGDKALMSNNSGYYNSAFGDQSLMTNSTGQYNTSMGYWSLRLNTAFYNTAFGANALPANTSGQSNTAVGMQSLFVNTDGTENTAMGYGALSANLGGGRNTAFGMNSLLSNTVGTYNTAVGYGAFISGTSFNFSSGIGYNATITANYQVRVGDGSTTSIGGQVGWTTVSDKRFKINVKSNVPGLDFIKKLKPVTYNLDIDAIADFIKTPAHLRNKEGEKAKKEMLQTGFIAQEVAQAAKESDFNFSGIDFPKNDQDYYGLRYAEFTVPLVRAVQEQQVMIDNYISKLSDLETRLTALEKLLNIKN